MRPAGFCWLSQSTAIKKKRRHRSNAGKVTSYRSHAAFSLTWRKKWKSQDDRPIQISLLEIGSIWRSFLLSRPLGAFA